MGNENCEMNSIVSHFSYAMNCFPLNVAFVTHIRCTWLHISMPFSPDFHHKEYYLSEHSSLFIQKQRHDDYLAYIFLPFNSNVELNGKAFLFLSISRAHWMNFHYKTDYLINRIKTHEATYNFRLLRQIIAISLITQSSMYSTATNLTHFFSINNHYEGRKFRFKFETENKIFNYMSSHFHNMPAR